MLKGLEYLEQNLLDLNIPFFLLLGSPKDVLPSFAVQNNCNLMVTDFGALRISKEWLLGVGKECHSKKIHLSQVDAHNVVPVWITSNKQEYAARTIRPKINRNLKRYLVEYPAVIHHAFNPKLNHKKTDWKKTRNALKIDMSVGIVSWCKPGTDRAMKELHCFITQRLSIFGKDRNNPTKNALSNLSPWQHFGQISPQRAALEVRKYANKYKESVDSYLEELIVRRELSDNFCFYNNDYDQIRGASQWAQDTLELHEYDEREYLYTLQQLETFQTHDDLWNAAQKQLVRDGKMHGFLRMYWAKKILEWTQTPKDALKHSLYLNDKYSLDGNDPNGVKQIYFYFKFIFYLYSFSLLAVCGVSAVSMTRDGRKGPFSAKSDL